MHKNLFTNWRDKILVGSVCNLYVKILKLDNHISFNKKKGTEAKLYKRF